jgi:dipeptidyl aminopeptidase/acylaminoacyl peptidase
MRGYYVVVPELGPDHFMNDAAKAKLDGVVTDVLKQQHIQHDRVHVMGTSMGAGSSLAYAIHRPNLIQSVCAVMPMTDFARWVIENPKYKPVIAEAFGGTYQQTPAVYERNSAVNNVPAFKNIPVMLVHGTADRVVEYEQSQRLAELLKAAGYKYDICTVADGTHKDDVMESCQLKAAEFFDKATDQRLSSLKTH